MIRLAKGETPIVLSENAEQWTADFLKYFDKGEKAPDSVRFRYRDPEIKSAIRLETSDKCAYCESKVPHSQPGDTEHIRPVSKNPSLIYDWMNLTYVCRECNQKKSDYDNEEEPLINPYTSDPEEHVTFFGPMAVQRLGDMLGERTINVVGLKREHLLLRRAERLSELMHLVERWNALPAGDTKNSFQRELAAHCEGQAEYSACIRAFLVQRGVLAA